jgi:hypothetical protein
MPVQDTLFSLDLSSHALQELDWFVLRFISSEQTLEQINPVGLSPRIFGVVPPLDCSLSFCQLSRAFGST